MQQRPTPRFRPVLERLEAKHLLATAAARALVAHPMADSPAEISQPIIATAAGSRSAADGGSVTAAAVKPNFGYLVYRLTNPTPSTNSLTPPFGHVLVQVRQPLVGQQYNIMFVALKNATKRTFDASSNFSVKITPQHRYVPILTGGETWKPGQDYIFYVLTKKYYPLRNQVSDGFIFKLDGARSVAIPGPSGIFLRIKYNPETIDKILDYAATRGPGAQGGAGIRTGLADTAIWAFVSSKKNRNDFGGYF